MAKVANLMANHNGTPAAVSSLYDEKISEVETFFVDSDTLTAIYFDTDTGIVDKCTHEYDWQYVTSSSDTVIENVVTDTSVSGYSLSFNSADKARAYLAFLYNDTYTSGHLKTIEGIFFVDTSTSTSGTSVLFSYAGYSYWLFNGGNGKSNFVYYLSCSYSESSASLNYSFMGTSATVAIPLSTFDEPFHVAYSADFVNRKAYIFLNGSLLATINDKIRSSGKTGSENYYFRSVYILRIIAPGCMCTAVLPDGESAINMARKSVYGVNTADTLNGRCLEFRVSLSTKYTENFTPYKSTVFAPNLPVKGNLCVQALNPNIKALLHFDDTVNPYKDECGNTWIKSGSPQIVDGYFGKALYINDGNSNCIYSNKGWYLGGKDFTIDLWAYILSTSPDAACFFKFEKNINEFTPPLAALYSVDAKSATTRIGVHFYNSASNRGIWTTTAYVTTDAWHHYAVCYKHDAKKIYLFIDGEKHLEETCNQSQIFYQQLGLGRVHNGGRHNFCYIDEFRFVDGKALWTSNFTPPDKPHSLTKTLYAPLVMENSPSADAQTKALLHFDDPNNPLKDECGNIWHIDGAPYINTSNAKFGNSIHSALTYLNGVWRLFINGILKISYSLTLTFKKYQINLAANYSDAWGVFSTDVASSCRFRGYFDEFRFVDGKALWTSNFTPPSAPYSLNTVNTKQPPCIGVRNQGNNFYTVR